MERPNDLRRGVTAILFVVALYYFSIGVFSSQIDVYIVQDLVILGAIVAILALIFIFLPRNFRSHFTGLVTIFFTVIGMLITTNAVLQVLLILLFVAEIVYLVFYLGIYTTCIDQVNELGIMSEEYIPPFNTRMVQESSPDDSAIPTETVK